MPPRRSVAPSSPLRRGWPWLLAALLACLAQARGDDPLATPEGAVVALVGAVRAALHDATLDGARRRAEVERVIERHCDFAVVAKHALGKQWGKVKADQRNELMGLLRDRLLAQWWPRLAGGAGADVTIGESTGESDQLRTVSTRVVLNGHTTAVSYKLYRRDSEWLVYDVLIEQDSLLRALRDDMQAQLRSGGIAGLRRELDAEAAQRTRAASR